MNLNMSQSDLKTIIKKSKLDIKWAKKHKKNVYVYQLEGPNSVTPFRFDCIFGTDAREATDFFKRFGPLNAKVLNMYRIKL